MTKIRSPENAEVICTLIAEGYTLRQVAREVGLSRASDITAWARDDEEFRLQYARAKEAQADHFAEEIVAISDDGTNDWITRETESGGVITVPDHEHIQRSKLRVDARKWLMAKMAPKRYGEALAITGKDGADLIPAEVEPSKVALALLALLRRDDLALMPPEDDTPVQPVPLRLIDGS